MLWYNDLAAEVQREIRALDWEPLLQERVPEVTSRPKTIDTLRQKLIRDHDRPMSGVQDIAGVRFEAEMSLDEQDAVVNAIAGRFAHDLDACVRDMRDEPHSGYRAVHIWLRLEGRVEVQVRTHLQGHWANMYESAADLYGRDIRYEWLPDDQEAAQMVTALRELSTLRIAQMERDRNEFELLSLQLEEAGVVVKDQRGHPTPTGARLATLKTRYRSNEARMQKDLQTLSRFFESVRAAGRDD
ncbi:hypothetical protein [Agromyces flavus]|nr:hypothetical protein [Agromyces flavus]